MALLRSGQCSGVECSKHASQLSRDSSAVPNSYWREKDGQRKDLLY